MLLPLSGCSWLFGEDGLFPDNAGRYQTAPELAPIDVGSPTHKMLQQYLTTTHAATHSSYALALEQVRVHASPAPDQEPDSARLARAPLRSPALVFVTCGRSLTCRR